MPWTRVVGGVGRVLVASGLLVLLFAAHQLWGTALAEARAQDDLQEELAERFAEDATTTATQPTTTSTSAGGGQRPAPTTTVAAPPPPAPTPVPGEALAIIEIPRIDLTKAVVEGVSTEDLRKAPGHYPGTPLPGQPGNVGIAGHRTTYGAPFGALGELVEGDAITVTTEQGSFTYAVDRIEVVSPAQVEVLDGSPDEARLTLTTCHPRYSARERLVVSAVLEGEPVEATPPAGPPGAADPDPTDPDPAGTGTEGSGGGRGTTGTSGATAEVVGAFEEGDLAGDPAARAPAALWAAATGLVALGAWVAGRRWRTWPSYLLALPVGAATLFTCFEHVGRLLPSNL